MQSSFIFECNWAAYSSVEIWKETKQNETKTTQKQNKMIQMFHNLTQIFLKRTEQAIITYILELSKTKSKTAKAKS